MMFLPGARKPFALRAQRAGAVFPRDRERAHRRSVITRGGHRPPTPPGTVSAAAAFATITGKTRVIPMLLGRTGYEG